MAKLVELAELAMHEKNLYKKKLKILQTVMSILILVVSKSNQQIVNLSHSLSEQQQQYPQTNNEVQTPSINDTNSLKSELYLTPSSRSICTDSISNNTDNQSTVLATTTLPLATQRRILGDESLGASNQNQTEDLLIQESQNNQSTFRFSSLAPEQIVEPITAPISNNNELYKNHNINNNNKNLADFSPPSYDSTNMTIKSSTNSQEPKYFKPPDEFLANYWLQDNHQLFNHRLPNNESTFKASSRHYIANQDNQESYNNNHGGSNLVGALSNYFMPVSRQQLSTSLQNLSSPSDLITSLSNGLDATEKQSIGQLSQPINEPTSMISSSESLGLARHKQRRLLMEQLNLQKINNDLIKLALEQQKSPQQQHNYGYQLSKQLATRQPAHKIQKIYSHNQLIYPSYLQPISHQNALSNPKVKHIQLGRLLPFTNKLRHKKFQYQQTTTGKPLIEDLQTSAHSQDIQLDLPRDIVTNSHQQLNNNINNSPSSNSFATHQIPLNHQQAAVGLDQLSRLQAKVSSNNPILTKYTNMKNLRQVQLQSLADTIDPSASALLSAAASSSIPLSAKAHRLQRFESMNSQIPAASGFNPQNAIEIGDQGPSTMSYSLLPSADSQTDADSALTGLDQDQFIKALQQSAALGAPSSVQEVAQDPVGASDAALASLFETMLKNAINSTNIHKPSDNVQSSSSHNSNQQQQQQQQQMIQPQQQSQSNQMQSSTNFLNNQSPITSPKFNSLHGHQQQQNHMAYSGAYNHQGSLIPPPPLMGDDPLQQHSQQHNQLHGPGSPDSSQLGDNNYQMYDLMPPQRKRKKNKKRKSGNSGPGGSNKQPQIRVAKRPRTGTGNPGFYDVNSQNDLEPSATFHKWKYPWLYGPNAGAFRPGDEDEEEEGETEVNIRFFNNFSRMGPFGQLTRAGGTATLVVSLAFLIISNISLAATVIAHGISSFLRNHSNPDRTKTIVRKRETTASPAAQKSTDDLSFYSSNLADSSLRSPSKTLSTTTSNNNTTTTSTTTVPGTELDEKIKSFGREWET